MCSRSTSIAGKSSIFRSDRPSVIFKILEKIVNLISLFISIVCHATIVQISATNSCHRAGNRRGAVNCAAAKAFNRPSSATQHKRWAHSVLSARLWFSFETFNQKSNVNRLKMSERERATSSRARRKPVFFCSHSARDFGVWSGVEHTHTHAECTENKWKHTHTQN